MSDERDANRPPQGMTGTNELSSGIDVVRNRIKGFAQKKVTLPPGRHKLVILDEADRYCRSISGLTPFTLALSGALSLETRP